MAKVYSFIVIPAQAGIHKNFIARKWAYGFEGVTNVSLLANGPS